jgi:2-dehydro-3-deoxyphosphogluconate aldolase / (4S)-4-hydroxy-2-oxoglutarate aldolase
MNKQQVLETIGQSRLVAVVRVDRPDQIDPTVDALLAGGIHVIELTMTIPDVLSHVPALRERVGSQMVLGIGSVLNGEMAQNVVDSGASFIVSPILRKDIVDVARAADVAVSVGAVAPTEIQTAWEYGSDVVKVFPAGELGPSFIKGVRAPMPHLRLLPTGGVSESNVGEWLSAGCFALGIGNALVDIKAIREGNYDVLTRKAEGLVRAVARWKESAGRLNQ